MSQLVCIVICLPASSGLAQTHPPPELTVELSFQADEGIFPKSWRTEEIKAIAAPLAPDLRDACRKVVGDELAKYPPELLNEHLKTIYLLSDLGFKGVKASGTSSRQNVYLAYHGNPRDPAFAWFRRVLHSEVSSIFFRNFQRRFPSESWAAMHPSGFQYGQGGVSAVRQKLTGGFFQEDLLRDGFVGRYAQSSMENDFNAVAGQLFVGSSQLWQAADRFPALTHKVDLTIEFYQGLNPALDRRYFQSLRVEAPHQGVNASDN